jgi:hypothetical protein
MHFLCERKSQERSAEEVKPVAFRADKIPQRPTVPKVHDKQSYSRRALCIWAGPIPVISI